MKKTATLLFLNLLFLCIKAQETKIFACNYGFQKVIDPNCSVTNVSVQSNQEAIRVVDKILAPIGLKRNFVLVSCPGINNALAITSDNGIRYIVYDNEFISSLIKLSSDWTNTSILAHEIGHHLLGHTLKKSLSLEEQRQKELDADEFSGFILFKLGASLKDTQAPINLISNEIINTNSTHPPRNARLLAIKRGYDKANSNQLIKYVNTGFEPEIFFAKAYKLTDEGKYEEAIDNYTTAIGINPKFVEAYINRAQVRFQLPVEKRNFSEIISDCNKAIQLDSNLGIPYYNRGLAEMFNADYELALKDFDFALKLDPSIEGHQFFLHRTFVDLKIKEKSKSISDLDGDIKKNQNNSIALFQRGQKKMESGKLEDAILDFTSAIENDSRNPKYYDFRGMAKVELGLHKEAIKDFDASIRINPGVYLSYYNRGITYKILEDYDKAVADFNVCVILHPNNEDFVITRGFVRRQLEDYEGALDDFNKVINNNPKNDLAWLEKAVTKAEMGNHKDAISDLNKALAVNPKSEHISYHYYHRGLCKIALNDKTGGCQDLKKSCELGLSQACDDLKEYCK